jgi:hypothetical protein
MKYAKTYERVINRSGVTGLQTTVVFSDGSKTVHEDFLKSGQKKVKQLTGGKR